MPTMSSVACSKCGVFMKCSKTGQLVEELDSQGGSYKIWSCDEFTCGECGAKIVTRFGAGPISEHYQDDYRKWRERAAYPIK